MRRNTPKRAKQNREYSKERREYIDEEIEIHHKVTCIFCGKTVYGDPDIHHAFGRDGDRITKKDDWLLAHNKCHVYEYHSMSWKAIDWWGDYIARIKDRYPKVYAKEIIKMGKTKNNE